MVHWDSCSIFSCRPLSLSQYANKNIVFLSVFLLPPTADAAWPRQAGFISSLGTTWRVWSLWRKVLYKKKDLGSVNLSAGRQDAALSSGLRGEKKSGSLLKKFQSLAPPRSPFDPQQCRREEEGKEGVGNCVNTGSPWWHHQRLCVPVWLPATSCR